MKRAINTKAAALKYEMYSNQAPKVLASGEGEIAKKIIEKAKEFDVAIFKNEELVNSLLKLEIGDEIPRELYLAVVEVFVWLAKMEKKAQMS